MLTYTAFRQALGLKQVNMTTDAFEVYLVDLTAYSPDADVDTALADVPSGAQIAHATLGTHTWTNAVFDAPDLTITSVTSALTAEGVLLYDTTASKLFCLADTSDDGSPISLTFNGSNVTIVWSTSGIWALL